MALMLGLMLGRMTLRLRNSHAFRKSRSVEHLLPRSASRVPSASAINRLMSFFEATLARMEGVEAPVCRRPLSPRYRPLSPTCVQPRKE
jgi:hypothetical protein